jgi:diaminopimelate epimerase
MTDFIKMHGLGNDFVVLDGRVEPLALTSAQAQAIAERRTGVGCDQIIVLESRRDAKADLFMRILNADGSETGACGNATRCVASLIMAETGQDKAIIETMVGLLYCSAAPAGLVAVNMGLARFDWRELPAAHEVDTLHLGIAEGPLADPVGVSMGNPHAVFFVSDVEAVDLATHGPKLEHHALFPERCNIEVAEILSPERIRMRVWERGAGITNACGTGACATLVAAVRRGLSASRAELILDGGSLFIEWLEDGTVSMTGPVARSFDGRLDESLLA